MPEPNEQEPHATRPSLVEDDYHRCLTELDDLLPGSELAVSTETLIPLTVTSCNPSSLVEKILSVADACLAQNDFVEAHCWFRFLAALKEPHADNTAATISLMWQDSGKVHEAATVLRDASMTDLSPELQSIVDDSQQQRIDAWSRSQVSGDPLAPLRGDVQSVILMLRKHFIRQTFAWQENPELEKTRAECASSLLDIFMGWRSTAMGDPSNKFGIRGLLDDTPHSDAMQPSWDKHGNFNFEEQQKGGFLFMRSLQDPGIHPNQIENALYNEQLPGSQLCTAKLYSKPSVRIPYSKFVSVGSLLNMDHLVRFQDLPCSSFVSQCHFAVSHRWQSPKHPDPDGSTLRRLKSILTQVDGISWDDGVFIDYCCIPQDPCSEKEAAQRLIASSSMDQLYKNAHIIFLPSQDFFVRSWCWHEFACWLFSPRPTQALCDHTGAIFNTLMEVSLFLFRKPVFLLDRVELDKFEGAWGLSHTQASKKNDKHVIRTMCAMNVQEQPMSASLIELLTTIVWKLETYLSVSSPVTIPKQGVVSTKMQGHPEAALTREYPGLEVASGCCAIL